MNKMKNMRAEELLPLAQQGNAEAQWRIGMCYVDGDGVPQDYAKAAGWFRKAAEQGNPRAQSFLGACYTDGCEQAAGGQGIKPRARGCSASLHFSRTTGLTAQPCRRSCTATTCVAVTMMQECP